MIHFPATETFKSKVVLIVVNCERYFVNMLWVYSRIITTSHLFTVKKLKESNMQWCVVKFLKEKSVAAVPNSWIRKLNNSVECYWPKKNVESLRKKKVQPAIKEGSTSTMYECKIVLDGGKYSSSKKLITTTVCFSCNNFSC